MPESIDGHPTEVPAVRDGTGEVTEGIICDYSDGDSDYDGFPIWNYNCQKPATYEFTGIGADGKIAWQVYYCGDCARRMREQISDCGEKFVERLI